VDISTPLGHRPQPAWSSESATATNSPTGILTVHLTAAHISSQQGGHTLDLDATVTRHIEQVLDQAGGKIHGPGGAAELLGVNPNSLRSKMRKLGIPFRKNRPRN